MKIGDPAWRIFYNAPIVNYTLVTNLSKAMLKVVPQCYPGLHNEARVAVEIAKKYISDHPDVRSLANESSSWFLDILKGSRECTDSPLGSTCFNSSVSFSFPPNNEDVIFLRILNWNSTAKSILADISRTFEGYDFYYQALKYHSGKVCEVLYIPGFEKAYKVCTCPKQGEIDYSMLKQLCENRDSFLPPSSTSSGHAIVPIALAGIGLWAIYKGYFCKRQTSGQSWKIFGVAALALSAITAARA